MKNLTAHQQNDLLSLARSVASTFRDEIERDAPMDSGDMCEAIRTWAEQAGRVIGPVAGGATDRTGRREACVVMACETCGSTDVLRDAWAEWDVVSQSWVLGETFDHTYCNACEGEASIQRRVLPSAAEASHA